MGIQGVGSSVVIALAAVLWLFYLIPTWFRRREYMSTERNAVRLQQTLRIMAETAEVPQSVHVESNARSIAAQQKLLREEIERQRSVERANEAELKRARAHVLATPEPPVTRVVSSSSARRLRRSRAATSAVLLVSLLTIALGTSPLVGTFSAVLLAVGATVAVGAVALLAVMASVGRSRARAARGLIRNFVVGDAVEEPRIFDAGVNESATAGWTPVPVPKPLYLSKPAVQAVVSETTIAEARAQLVADAEESERVLREAERSEKVTPIRRSPQFSPAASVNRFARMGVVDETDEGAVTDLDDVLRRRRAV